MRSILIVMGALALTACADADGPQPQGGIANYDSLRAAAKACEAQGGTLELSKGGDPENISDYACKRK
jgi:putative hemolysin